MKKKGWYIDYLFIAFGLFSFAFFAYLIILANADLALGRHVLFMDERITYDGVNKILHPDSIAQFIYYFLYGGDSRYGRILWNSIAILSFIPEKIFGAPGQIISARMLQFILVTLSYCMFAFGVMRSWFLRFALLVIIMTIPYSDYYVTIPKPEPLQIFFISVFVYFFIKKRANFCWYWIFLGLAFGAKISSLPVVIVFFLVTIYLRKIQNVKNIFDHPFIKSVFAFMIGLAISVPILLVPLSLIVVGFIFSRRTVKWYHFKSLWSLIAVVPVCVLWFFASFKVIKIWLASTFLNTSHGSDIQSINIFTWIEYLIHQWLVAPSIIGIILIAAIFIYFISAILIECSSKLVFSYRWLGAIVIAISGVAINFSVMFFSKRLWGFYLYPGTFLIIVGVFILIDYYAYNNKPDADLKDMALRIGGYSAAVGLLAVSGFYWVPNFKDGLNELALRTSSSQHILQNSSYQIYLKFLNDYSVLQGKRLDVMFSPSLFPPDSNDKFKITEFWGPYTKWNEYADVIIFDIINTPRGNMVAKESPDYQPFLIQRMGYLQHVIDINGGCKAKPCYKREIGLPNGGEVLVLIGPPS